MNPVVYLVDNLMLPLLEFFYDNIYQNYAVAIVFLTILVKVVFYHLNKKQFISMKKMTVLQPQIKKLQEKFKKEPQKQQVEIMALYKENNVNPIGGCLPLLIQMPFLFALFMTLRSEHFQSLVFAPDAISNFLWIKDLIKPDPLYILPILIGVTTWASQKTMSTDPKQAKMLAFMPVLMVFFSWSFPAGLQIYWGLSQVLTTAQQFYMNYFYDQIMKNEVKIKKEKK